MAIEHRAGCEFRVAGRTLTGVAMRYGDVSPDFRERFVPGAFGPVGSRTMPINLQHDPRSIVAKRALLNDTARALEVRAELPEGSAALSLVKRGALNGFSIEFKARSERREAGVRVVEKADLTGIALVDAGAYPQSKAEVRARSGRTMRAEIPVGRRAACECLGSDSCGVDVSQEVFDEAMEEAFTRSARGEGDLIAVAGSYSRGLASVSRGTLRRNGNVVEIDLPDSDGARALLAEHEAAGVIVRPVVDKVNSEYTSVDGVAQFSKLRIRAFVAGTTDIKGGWPEPKLVPTPRMDRAAPVRRRARVWL